MNKNTTNNNTTTVRSILCCIIAVWLFLFVRSTFLSVFIFHFFLSVGAREFVAVIIYLNFINIFSFFCYFCRFGWLIYWIWHDYNLTRQLTSFTLSTFSRLRMNSSKREREREHIHTHTSCGCRRLVFEPDLRLRAYIDLITKFVTIHYCYYYYFHRHICRLHTMYAVR